VCGIAGFELRGDDEGTAAILAERLARRGPDGNWFVPAEPYGLVQTRLAIVDLSERVQYPLRNESGDVYLLFNGEIYDHRRLRVELERLGHRFATDCDAEVVVHGYEEWGLGLFRRLDGMFAVALFDRRSRELVLARDALGIKPLVYTTSGRFAFSSDALSLVAAGLASGVVDDSLGSDFLNFRYLFPPQTGLTSVRQVGPGEVLRRTSTGQLTLERWCPQPFTRPVIGSQVETEEVGELLDRSVRRQLAADVPVGVFLSSGLDSALVLESAVRAGAKPCAFTIGFPGHGGYDESPTASRLARDLGVPHEIGELDCGFAQSVDLVATAFDQPFADESAIAMAALARLARHRVTVALSGTGGDDLFAGYRRHRIHLYKALIGHVPRSVRGPLTHLGGSPGDENRSALALARSYVARLADVRGGDGLSQYLQLVSAASSQSAVRALRSTPAQSSVTKLERDFVWPSHGSMLRRIQAFELQTYLPGDLLPKEDRPSMAVGLEARVPLLGTELVELAERSRDRQKIGLLQGKRLLRELGRRRLPTYVTRARKRGFAVPLAELFAGPWRSEAIEWFAASPSQIVDGTAAARLLQANELPATDAWTLATLIGWERVLADARGQGASAPR
jgi:asparagine synthase (glutamine-hydrolysing)